MALLDTTGLEVTIGGRTICRGLDLTIAEGEFWGVLGTNGAGKTTLLHTLAGLRPTRRGSIRIMGTELTAVPRGDVARSLGVMFQDSPDPFPNSVLETALIGRHPFLGRWRWEGNRDLELSRAALASVGLAHCEGRLTSTLSGGERRRLALATLLTQDPVIALLDEPLNHLDLGHQVTVMDILRARCQTSGRAVLMSLHDVNLAAHYCTGLLLLDDGEARTGPPDHVLNETAIERLYGQPVRRISAGDGVLFAPVLRKPFGRRG